MDFHTAEKKILSLSRICAYFYFGWCLVLMFHDKTKVTPKSFYGCQCQQKGQPCLLSPLTITFNVKLLFLNHGKQSSVGHPHLNMTILKSGTSGLSLQKHNTHVTARKALQTYSSLKVS